MILNIYEISKRFNMEYINNDVFSLIDNNNITYLDVFPNVIKDNNDYGKNEIYYQGVFNNSVSRDDYIYTECKFIGFVRSLLKESPAYSMFFPDSNRLKFRHYFKIDSCKWSYSKSRALKRELKEIIHSFNEKHGEMYECTSSEFVEYICKLAIRDAGFLVMYFQNIELMLIIRDCIGILNINHNTNQHFVCTIAKENELYIYAYSDNQ